MKLFILYTRSLPSGRWHRGSVALNRADCLAGTFNPSPTPEAVFKRFADDNRAYLAVHEVAICPTDVIRPRTRRVLNEWLLHDCRTLLRQVTYDAKWHLVRPDRRYLRISSQRAAALLGAFNRWLKRTGGAGCHRVAPLLD